MLVNADALALLHTKAAVARSLLADPQHKAWRDKLYDDITGPPCRRSSPSGPRRS